MGDATKECEDQGETRDSFALDSLIRPLRRRFSENDFLSAVRPTRVHKSSISTISSDEEFSNFPYDSKLFC